MFRLHGEASDVSYAKMSVFQVIARFTSQQKASTCAYVLTGLTMSSNMSCSKFFKPKLYPDRQPYSRNKARTLASQVVIAVSFMLPLSSFSTHIKKIVRFVPARMWHISLQKCTLGTNTQGNSYFALEHTQELPISK